MNGLHVDLRDGAARLTLDRPGQGNAFDLPLAQALGEAARRCADDPEVRCVVVTGAGRLFCTGGDIGAFAEAGDRADQYLRRLADTLHDALRTLATMAKPLVMLVNGPAAGAGLSLAALGDIVIAGASAHFTAAYTSVGLTPDGGMSWTLPRLVGLRRAQEMILANRRVSAEEAVAIGLITRVVADEELADEGAMLIARLVEGPTAALGAARGLLLESGLRSLSDHLDVEAATIAAAGARDEARTRIAAFMSRKPPSQGG